MVLTAYFGLSSVTGLSCHRRLQVTTCKLERQRRGVRTTRLRRPRAARSSKAQPASIASRSNVRDDRETPLNRDGTVLDVKVIWVERKQESFCGTGWTDLQLICPAGTIWTGSQ
jgi:hypothetical protein